MSFGSWLHDRAQRRERQHWARYMYEAALSSKYKPNNKSVEIIGLPSAVFTHITTDATPGSLTQTTFDTSSRADSAQILLTNSTGASRVIIAAWIRGKPVTRYSDIKAGAIPGSIGGGGGGGGRGGYLHDKFVDYESISKNGERVFETGNNFTVTADQVNKLADYYWKLNKTKKHIYTLSLVGFQTWYEPGEWYTLQIGGAGEAEYIDSTVECFDVRLSLGAGSAPGTMVAFREVEENWKFDSNEVSRQISAGDFSRRPTHNFVTVVSQYNSGYGDLYCDGTNDQEEINTAISYGKAVYLTRGTYNITSSIAAVDNMYLFGDGPETVISKNCNAPAIAIYGTSTTSITSTRISNLKVTRAEADGNLANLIEYSYAYDAEIDNCYITNAYGYGIAAGVAGVGPSDGFRIINNVIGDNTSSATVSKGIACGVGATSITENLIANNIIRNITSLGDGTDGIFIGYDGCLTKTTVVNNRISNIECTASSYTAYGIRVQTNGAHVTSNNVEGVKNTDTADNAIGIFISTGSTSTIMINNRAYNNGDDTGIANTNRQNFYDAGTDTQWAG